MPLSVFGADRPPSREEIVREAAGCSTLLTLVSDRVDGALLDALPSVRHVAQVAVGYDNVDVEACRARGVLVTHTPDVLTDATADLAFALILAVGRRLREGEALLRSGRFVGWSPTMLLGMELSRRGRSASTVSGASAARWPGARWGSGCGSSTARGARRRRRSSARSGPSASRSTISSGART